MASIATTDNVDDCQDHLLDSGEFTLTASVAVQPALDVETTRQRLIELEIIEADQWDAATKSAGTTTQLIAILSALQQMPARWDSAVEESFPAITLFQMSRILAGKPDDLRLDHYILLEELGRGGMGEVYKARNTRLPRLEAVKTIRTSDFLTEGSEPSLGVERFQREAKLLTQLQHSNLTTIFHAGQDRGVQFIAIEYVRGSNLKQFIDQLNSDGREMPVSTAVGHMITVAEVLGHAHGRGVVHRDVKPANIMLTEAGVLKVLDLGIAQLRTQKNAKNLAATELTEGDTTLGTPEVMAPEQWADAQSVTAASDVYSLGCTLFFALTGRMPFLANKREELLMAAISAPRPSATKLRSDVPSGLSEVIKKMLATDPSDRYQSCDAVIKALMPYSDRHGTSRVGVGHTQLSKVWIWATMATLTSLLVIAAITDKPTSLDSQSTVSERQITTELATAFDQLNPPAIPQDLSPEETQTVRYDYDNFLHQAEWLLQVQSAPELYEEDLLQVEALVGGKASDVVRVGEDMTLRVRARRSGFVTMLAFASSQKINLLNWTVRIEVDQWQTLLVTDAETPGDDECVLFFTDTNPMAEGPDRPLSLGPNISQSDDFEQGLRVSQYKWQDRGNISAAFSHPRIFERVVADLTSGNPYPFQQLKPPVTWWSRTAMTLHVIDRMDN